MASKGIPTILEMEVLPRGVLGFPKSFDSGLPSAFRFARVSAHQLATYLREEHRIVVAEKSDNGIRVDIAYFVAPQEREDGRDHRPRDPEGPVSHSRKV